MVEDSEAKLPREIASEEAGDLADPKVRSTLDELMEEAGLVSDTRQHELEQEAAQPYAQQELPRPGYTLEDQVDIQRSLAERLGMPYVDVTAIRPTPDLLEILPKRVVVRYKIFPVGRTETTVRVAFSDPYNVMAVQDVQLILDEQGLALEQCLGDEDDIGQAIDQWYRFEKDQIVSMMDQVAGEVATTKSKEMISPAIETETIEELEVEDDFGALARSLENVDVEVHQAPLVRLINLIFLKALKMRSSDIHFEPYPDDFRIRFRIDGVLHDIESPPQKLQAAMVTRLKILAGVDLAEKRIPQDGRIQMRMEGKDIDFRVSTLPSIWGESVVLRLLDKTGLMLGLEEVGFMPDNVALFGKLIRRPNGIILMTGPTGSGKTTTLYAALNLINSVDVKIITVEQPVEYMIEGINQVQVNETIGLTFASVLRTMLRQAPNIILVGEIRDRETAETSIRAALTGHLVFSTLHTNDASGAPSRLIEMGIKPYLVSSSLQAIVAQRLVRLICRDCKEMYYPPPAHIREFGMDPDDFRGQPFYQGVGCHSCGFTGYKGRTAVHEIMVLSDDLRQMIITSTSSDRIRKKACEEGMRVLREDGWQKILQGDTTLEEVMRVTGDTA